MSIKISMKVMCALAMLLLCNLASAMDGVFDRSAEIDGYIATLNSHATQEELFPTIRAIHISGINDERLAKAIADRLLSDLPHLDKNYGAWTVRALASTGGQIAKDTLVEVRDATHLKSIKTECEEQLKDIDWEHRKNEVMASRRNYTEGGNMRVAQLLNLLQSDDYTLKDNAAYRMNWDKNLDPRLMAEIAAQLTVFVDQGTVTKNKEEVSTIWKYVKMLGYSNDRQYVPLLKRIADSKADAKIKRYAANARDNLMKS